MHFFFCIERGTVEIESGSAGASVEHQVSSLPRPLAAYSGGIIGISSYEAVEKETI